MHQSHTSPSERVAAHELATQEVTASLAEFHRYRVERQEGFVFDRRLIPPPYLQKYRETDRASTELLKKLFVEKDLGVWTEFVTQAWSLHSQGILTVNHLDILENAMLATCNPQQPRGVEDTAQRSFG